MNKLNSKLLLAGTLSAALLAACGGSSNTADTPAAPAPDVVVTVTAVASYITGLFASTTDSSTPVDANLVILAEDNAAEPAAVN